MEAMIQTEWIYSGSQMLFYKLIISVNLPSEAKRGLYILYSVNPDQNFERINEKSQMKRCNPIFILVSKEEGRSPLKNYLNLDVRKPVFGGLRTTNAQTSLLIRAV